MDDHRWHRGDRRGVRRLTTDVGAVVRGDAIDAATLLGVLRRHDIVSRIDDALAFARRNLVLLVRHRPTGVDLDISFGWSDFEHHALEARSDTRYGRIRAPMAAPADLVVFKAVAGRPKDLEDVEALLLLYPKIDVAKVRRRVRELAALAEADDIAPQLERILTRLRSVRRAKKPSKRRQPR